MRDFVFAAGADFIDLERILSDGKLHVYYNRVLPKGCVPGKARIGFEKSSECYSVMIDKGIKSNASGTALDCLLEKGEIRFLCMDDMREFFYSLRTLFPEADAPDNNERHDGTEKAGSLPVQQQTGGEAQNSRQQTGGEAQNSRQQTGDETQNSRQQTGGETKNKRREEKPVIDRDKLRAIKEEQSVRKIVWPDEIAAPIKQEVYGQDAAIDTLSDAIVINRMQKKDKLLVMAFLGPPATGKSTVGRALAEVLSELYGNRYGFIEISANEYTQEHMVQKVLGAPPGYTGYGQTTVLEPVRKNQYHVILINEIEKAHEKLLVALMEAMDTGFLGMADNSPAIDLNHCILLFTSNIPIDMENYRIASEFERSELCKDAFTKHCGRSEISRRIQDFIVFVPLSEDARVDVIIKFARKALADMDAELIKIDERLMADFLKYKTKYGASELGNYVTRAIGKKMLKTRQPDLVRGKKVTVYGTVDSIEFQVS